MGRPLSKQQLFGANSNSNIKVQFYNGTASVPGYILEQTGSKRFKCEDADGNIAVCYLVDKASADLAAGEMTITLKYDDGTVQQATKISRHRVSVVYDGILQSFPWNFSTSTTDGAWQIEEAGTDDQLASATDLEQDDGPTIPPGMDRNAPLPGSGTWTSAAGAGVPTYALRGSLIADPGGAVTTVPGTPANGLYRRKHVGLCFDGANLTSTYDFAFFSDPMTGPISEAAYEVDNFIGFGARLDLPAEDGYSFEWKGYIKVPASGNYNTFISCDDDVAVWLGSAALNPTNSNQFHKQPYVNADASGGCTNSVTLDSTKWYPIRIWFTEFGGAERFKFYMNSSANGNLLGYDGTSSTILWSHNSVTKGY
jgi:hypothetical protein